MSRRACILSTFAAVLGGLAVGSSLVAAAESKPNIVVFLSDDHTMIDSSVYGSTEIETPGMKKVADAGMTFRQAFVASPSCAPSRAALLTGLMPARNGAEANHSRPRKEIKKLPAYLQELGYEVVSFGKVGHYRQTPDYGFDLARHFNYHEDVAVGEALKWLEARNSDRPLCLFVGTNWPHVPWPEAATIDPKQVVVPPTNVATPKTMQVRAKYLQAVRTMDDELGRTFDAVYRKLGQNTLFLHTSDHGAQWPFGKWTLYDAGVRTPLLAVWPGKIAPGAQSQAMVSWVDLLPTLVEAAGGKPDAALDGRSIAPVLLGRAEKHRDRIFLTHSGDGNNNVYPSRGLRDLKFKYILNLHPEYEFRSHVTNVPTADSYWSSWVEKAKTDPESAAKVKRYQQRPREELYDLEADPHEQHNLAEAADQAERLQEMREAVQAWMKEQGDQQTVFGTPKLLSQVGKPPNVVLVLIDDMGWADLSCFGGKDVKTPHIDRLAGEGVRFTRFYVNSPICSPSRTALTTGQYPARRRITSYLADRKLNEKRGMDQWLDVSAPTVPRMLSQAGYQCGHFGKWHLGGQRDVGEAPLIAEYGFSASLTNFEGLGPRVLPLCDAFDGSPAKRHDLGSAKLGRGPIEWEDRSLITARFVKRTLEFLDASQAAGRPFYVNVWPDDVHSPFFPPQAVRGDAAKRTLYLGVLQTMDAQLGVLFDRIREDESLRDNTLILLCSDNGHEPGAGSAGPLRGEKGNLYEGGVRSPLIVWGPGLVAPNAVGSVNGSTVVSSIDLVASLLPLTAASPPADYRLDGENLLPALLGQSTAPRRSPLFWRRPPDRPGPAAAPFPDLAVLDGPYKLLCDLDGSSPKLYDLSADPSESTNLANDRPRIVRRLTKSVLDWNAGLPPDGVSRK